MALQVSFVEGLVSAGIEWKLVVLEELSTS
jgi:hypothetical protein